MAISGDDFFWPQSPSTPVGQEGVTKREALVFFLTNGLGASLGESLIRSTIKGVEQDEVANEVWLAAQKILDADPTP